MINDNELTSGKTYFLVEYFDDNLSIPDIETYIYVGKSLLPSDLELNEEKWYFQDPESYLLKGKFTDSNEKKEFDILRADQVTLETMYDLEGLTSSLINIK